MSLLPTVAPNPSVKGTACGKPPLTSNVRRHNNTLAPLTMQYSFRSLRSASLALAVAVPGAALASIHADLGALSIVLLPVVIFREAGPLVMLAATYLFWKRQQIGWLLACSAIPTAIGLIVRLTVLLAPSIVSSGSLGPYFYKSLPFVFAGVQWLFFVIALAVKKPSPPSTASRGAA